MLILNMHMRASNVAICAIGNNKGIINNTHSHTSTHKEHDAQNR